jgi:signal transduction histidine kinase
VAGEWIATTNWLFGGIGVTLTFVLFPDGRLPGRAWRAVPIAAVVGAALALPGWSLSTVSDSEFASGHNPLAIDALPATVMLAAGLTLFLGALVAAVASLIVRFRRSSGIERQQLKWFTFAAAVAGVALPTTLALWYAVPAARVMAAVALTSLPVAACVAILRCRLYDIDVVISRTLVYGSLTIVLAAAFGATTVLLGAALGRGSAVATAGATLVVAVAFGPLRARLQDAVDRRFSRARYDAMRRMAAFLEDLRSGRAAPEDVERVLRELVADPRLELLFELSDADGYVDAHGLPTAPDDEREHVPIERGAQRLGLILHDASRDGDPALLRNVVEAGGLAIEIARLRVELRRRLAEVEASRARIVGAANDERRRIERDLHDGAQQRLVSIGLAMRHAQHELAGPAPHPATRTLDEAVAEIAVAIEELRELARGLPPAQLDAGLAPAFRELARRAPIPVEMRVAGERFDRGVEAAAYFIGCEALTNAVKHADATRVALSAGREDGKLVVSVADDGVGGATPTPGSGLSGLSDRVSAPGGTLRIASEPGGGTTLTAELPCGS